MDVLVFFGGADEESLVGSLKRIRLPVDIPLSRPQKKIFCWRGRINTGWIPYEDQVAYMLRNRTYNRKVAKTFMVLVRLLERICVSETHSTLLNMFLKHTFTTGSRFGKEDFMF